MTAQFIVLLTEEKDAVRGELKFLNTSADVAHYIEVLLEGGYAQENIRVFHGNEVELAISYRPVVSLAASEETPAEPTPDDSAEGAGASDGDVPEGEESDEAQGVRNGVRFSELFRPS
jgi:hypothetical protein